jgi:hypothetical protein
VERVLHPVLVRLGLVGGSMLPLTHGGPCPPDSRDIDHTASIWLPAGVVVVGVHGGGGGCIRVQVRVVFLEGDGCHVRECQ